MDKSTYVQAGLNLIKNGLVSSSAYTTPEENDITSISTISTVSPYSDGLVTSSNSFYGIAADSDEVVWTRNAQIEKKYGADITDLYKCHAYAAEYFSDKSRMMAFLYLVLESENLEVTNEFYLKMKYYNSQYKKHIKLRNELSDKYPDLRMLELRESHSVKEKSNSSWRQEIMDARDRTYDNPIKAFEKFL